MHAHKEAQAVEGAVQYACTEAIAHIQLHHTCMLLATLSWSGWSFMHAVPLVLGRAALMGHG